MGRIDENALEVWRFRRTSLKSGIIAPKRMPMPKLSKLDLTQKTRSRVEYCEIIANNLSKAGWSWGCISAD